MKTVQMTLDKDESLLCRIRIADPAFLGRP